MSRELVRNIMRERTDTVRCVKHWQQLLGKIKIRTWDAEHDTDSKATNIPTEPPACSKRPVIAVFNSFPNYVHGDASCDVGMLEKTCLDRNLYSFSQWTPIVGGHFWKIVGLIRSEYYGTNDIPPPPPRTPWLKDGPVQNLIFNIGMEIQNPSKYKYKQGYSSVVCEVCWLNAARCYTLSHETARLGNVMRYVHLFIIRSLSLIICHEDFTSATSSDPACYLFLSSWPHFLL